MLFNYSIALAVGVLVGLRGPRWGAITAFLTCLGIGWGTSVAVVPDHVNNPDFGWGVVAFGVVSLIGWVIRLAALVRTAGHA